jgi:hypothetical protein
MARLKLKQVLSNLSYDDTNDKLILTGGSSQPAFYIEGAVYVTSSSTVTGSVTIAGVDTFGDSGSFDSIDLGDY